MSNPELELPTAPHCLKSNWLPMGFNWIICAPRKKRMMIRPFLRFCLILTIAVASSGASVHGQTQTPIPAGNSTAKPTIQRIERSDISHLRTPSMSKKNSTSDTHSCARPDETVATHLDLAIAVNFDKQVIKGEATYTIKRKEGNTLMLDSKGLDIAAVKDDAGESLRFKLLDVDSVRGQAVVIILGEKSTKVTVSYATTAQSAGLQWLTPEQNDGKTPFLYSQGQAILTRSWIPIQDSPAILLTYSAKVTVPEGMVAVMSATGNVTQRIPKQTVYEFKQPNAIPAYLIALAVGNLEFKKITENTGIYALPSVLPSAVEEFSDLGKMVAAAEKLCGPYEWGRFDVLVMPPSFPFGGMENPMLTFATPTILAGDRSLVSLIVHELVHSWSGNLVTNANWNDFWLNEGWTVYLERRIVEMLNGKETADMMEVLGFQDLKATIADMPRNGADTGLRLKLEGRDPDDGMTDVAYERGAMVIKNIETAWGRMAFDPFIQAYFKQHRFKSITTDQFIEFTAKYAADNKLKMPDLPGMTMAVGEPHPDFKIFSDRMMGVEKARVAFLIGKNIQDFGAATWTAQERQYFLRIVKEPLSAAQLAIIEKALQLGVSKNSEVNFEWYMMCIRNGHEGIRPELEDFLSRVGRRKFVLPLYKAMFDNPEWKAWGGANYKKFRNRYHSITAGSVDRLL